MKAFDDEMAALRRAAADGKPLELRFFWGHRARPDGALSDSCFSQWWPAKFVDERDGATYATAEHYMMTAKARLFGDAASAAKILMTTDPGRAKALGRKVTGFEETTWEAGRIDIVVDANLRKFGQNEALRRYLLSTRDAVLVEASPLDRIWGIGLGAKNPDARDPWRWRGLNLLGFALMKVRATLR